MGLTPELKYRKGDKFRIIDEFFDPKTIYEAVEDSEYSAYGECVWFLHRNERMAVKVKYTSPYVESKGCICDIMDLMRQGCKCGDFVQNKDMKVVSTSITNDIFIN